MTEPLSFEAAPAGLGETLAEQGFTEFTSVQAAVLSPDLRGRDVRITSQTGSGKTVALGLLMAETVAAHVRGDRASGDRPSKGAGPAVLLVAPTRELAGQLGRELTWLYRPLGASVAVVTGGTSVFEEQRALRRGPTVLVGTPGRLNDHLRSRTLSLGSLEALALDEADEMLAMDFEEELLAIMAQIPDTCARHMVSATFAPNVRRLAGSMQRDPVLIQGTALGTANADIEHLWMTVNRPDRFPAAVNVVLRYPADKTLVFVRTRADTVALAEELARVGVQVRALNGEMTQRERTAAFQAFHSGATRCLVATDVAARGLDVQDVLRVLQVDVPENSDVYTHRAGRTGRAGRKGTCVMFAARSGESRLHGMLRQAGVRARQVEVPSPGDIDEAERERLVESFIARKTDGAHTELTDRLLRAGEAREVVEFLLERVVQQHGKNARSLAPQKSSKPRAARPVEEGNFVRYQITWGSLTGADRSRLLAMACRRGNIGSENVGAIRVSAKSSSVEISESVVDVFEAGLKQPDTRAPNVKFRRWNSELGDGAEESEAMPRTPHPGKKFRPKPKRKPH